MNYTRQDSSFISANGVDRIAFRIYTPDCKPKALIQIAHGMCEHSGRYEHFIDYICGKGFAVVINDHLGHGSSVSDSSDLGYFGLEKGWIAVINDLRRTYLRARSLFGRIPYFVIGHSMGSIAMRCYMAKYSEEIDGAVLLGTTGKHPALPFMVTLADQEIMLHGVKARSRKINSILFGMSNEKVDDKKTEFDWLSRDDKVVADFVADEKCGFVFTSAGFRDLFRMSEYCTDSSWYKKVRWDLPMLIMSGTDDPVGGYGKGVMQFYRALEARGFTDVDVRLYDGARHELLNETNRMEIYDDIADWLMRQDCMNK